MNRMALSVIVSALIFASPALAQTTTPPPETAPPVAQPPADTTNPATSTGTAGTPSDATTTSSAPALTPAPQDSEGSSETPSSVISSPAERNRLDPSAPSRFRLQIDPGSPGESATNPGTVSSNLAAPGEPYNAITEGAPSDNGASTGTTGRGVTPAPSPLSPSTYPQPLTFPPTPPATSTYPAPLISPTTPFTSGVGNRTQRRSWEHRHRIAGSEPILDRVA